MRFVLLLYYRQITVYCHCKLVLFELGHTFSEKLGTLERLSVHKLIVMDCTIKAYKKNQIYSFNYLNILF